MHDDAEKTIKEWENDLKEQELAEKRRVAPGWLDREEKILQPKRTSGVVSGPPVDDQTQSANIMDRQDEAQQDESRIGASQDSAGEELDRAFGGLRVRQ